MRIFRTFLHSYNKFTSRKAVVFVVLFKMREHFSSFIAGIHTKCIYFLFVCIILCGGRKGNMRAMRIDFIIMIRHFFNVDINKLTFFSFVLSLNTIIQMIMKVEHQMRLFLSKKLWMKDSHITHHHVASFKGNLLRIIMPSSFKIHKMMEFNKFIVFCLPSFSFRERAQNPPPIQT